MNIDVYCDEAYPDLFSSTKPQAKYLLIGSLWLPNEKRALFKKEIHTLRHQYKIGGEIKWTKVSPSKIEFYKELISWFFDKGRELRFRCIVIDRDKVDLVRFQESDQELGFYKFYYQMLLHWIHPFNTYSIYSDLKSTRLRDRLKTLRACLKNANLTAEIPITQSVRSKESVLIQLSDLLVGLTAAKMNRCLKEDSAKQELVHHVEKNIGGTISSTPLNEKKFNVFKINLKGGW